MGTKLDKLCNRR